MRKRRRAYKKYNWREHQFQCLLSDAKKKLADEIANAILCGANEMPCVRIAMPNYLLRKLR